MYAIRVCTIYCLILMLLYCGYSLLQCLIYHIVERECIYKLYYFSIHLFQYRMSLLCDNFGNKFAMNERILMKRRTHKGGGHLDIVVCH